MKNMYQKLLAAIVVIAVVGAFYYRDSLSVLFTKKDEAAQPEFMVSREGLRKVSTTASYEGDKFKHTILFDVYLDAEGVIKDIETTDTEDAAHNANLKSFSEKLLVQIQGKKLSEIGSVDKVGTSSYTTEAFNEALARLQEQV